VASSLSTGESKTRTALDKPSHAHGYRFDGQSFEMYPQWILRVHPTVMMASRLESVRSPRDLLGASVLARSRDLDVHECTVRNVTDVFVSARTNSI